MKNIVLAMLIGSSALVTVPALAQTSDASPAAPAPAAPAANDTASTAAPAMAATPGDFVTKREANQFLASNIRGANVMGPQNESIGTVSDMIIGEDGRLAAVTVDVGGFLGIGAKTVAIPADGLKYVPVAATTSGNMANNSTMAPAGTAAPAAGTTAPASDPTTTGSTNADNSAAGGAMSGTSATAAASDDGSRLDHIMVNFTREQLQNAPEFDD
ncbi:PRC-barrel domain-containing protein [Aureimonas leprariae]|uniref:PRC-barrel domain containing protein n=1 Tax=Plantimonas leprariae TaxID=2615207 RepID=A0A7V7TXS6_9HYPH|nr:PRC-barrel domain-containing protein [Aureimonas leprariae]KAB0681851.1 PRC-barrel domain containing protein [Aureimonas leprariae]